MKVKTKAEYRKRRHMRLRRRINGTAMRPRLCVYKSNSHLYVQLIDDEAGHTLASVSSYSGECKGANPSVETASKLGKQIAEKAKDAGIESAVFDRGGFIYTGKIAAIAEGAREAGLSI